MRAMDGVSARRILAGSLVLLALLGLASCGADVEKPSPVARVRIAVLADGSAEVDLFAAGKLKSDAEVRALAGRVAEQAFPEASGTRASTETSRGQPFARVVVTRAYRPARTVSLNLDTAEVWRQLRARGFTEVTFKVLLPSVPATVTSGRLSSRLRDDRPPQPVRVVMKPEPARWTAAITLPVAGALFVTLAFFARRRPLALPAALAAVVTAIIAVTKSAGAQGDNLGVAGVLEGRPLEVATIAPLAAVALALPALMLLATAALRWHEPANRIEPRPTGTGVFW
ncbi:hypothetical protein [Spirillospora sp. CA-294931]|uniref:hypothetical protein n=1 Tax=Spirillospora sp. CA-294931 TaxID=3240042 RepID=UPI003D8D2BE6